MYCGGKDPASPNTPPWKVAENTLIRTMTLRVTARNSCCQLSVLILAKVRVAVKKTTTIASESNNLLRNVDADVWIIPKTICFFTFYPS